MILLLERSGGFAGLRQILGPVDTAQLPDDVRDRVEAGVREGVQAASLRGATGAAGGQPDRFTYRLTVEPPESDEAEAEAIELGESPEIRSLIQLLTSTGATWRPAPS